MPRKKKAENTEAIPQLFKTELGVCNKVQLKDAWGNTAFMIKGDVPEWVKDVDVEVLSYHRPLSDMTLKDLFTKRTEGCELVKVDSLTPVAAIHKDVAYIIVRLDDAKKNTLHVQRVFLDTLQKTYPTSVLYVSYPVTDVPIIVAKVGNEIVCMLTAISLNNVRLVNAEELMEIYKEWSKDVKGIDVSNYK